MCSDGCISGGLTVEAARRPAQHQCASRSGSRASGGYEEQVRSMQLAHFFRHGDRDPHPAIEQIPKDLKKAVALKKKRAEMLKLLPSKNCGACGSPDCKTLVEDVLRGEAQLRDCVFVKIPAPGAGAQREERRRRVTQAYARHRGALSAVQADAHRGQPPAPARAREGEPEGGPAGAERGSSATTPSRPTWSSRTGGRSTSPAPSATPA